MHLNSQPTEHQSSALSIMRKRKWEVNDCIIMFQCFQFNSGDSSNRTKDQQNKKNTNDTNQFHENRMLKIPVRCMTDVSMVIFRENISVFNVMSISIMVFMVQQQHVGFDTDIAVFIARPDTLKEEHSLLTNGYSVTAHPCWLLGQS